MNKYILLFTILSFFYACQREMIDELNQDNKLDDYDDEMIDCIDVEVYNSLVKFDNFQYLVVLCEENKNAIYTCTDENLHEYCLKADTIRSLISYYSSKFSIADLSLYIAKCVNSKLVMQSRCLLNEKIEDCWKRAWEYYDKTFVDNIYKMIYNPNDIINDISSFLSGSYGTFGVQRVFNIFQDKKARPSVELLKQQKNGLINLLLSKNINITPIFDGSDVSDAERDVHNINEYLSDGFYWYYTGNRWRDVAKFKKDTHVCSICGEDPCICETKCPVCGREIKSCLCCEKCKFYPCRCYKEVTPAWVFFEYQNVVDECWVLERIGSYFDNLSTYKNYCTFYDWKMERGQPNPRRTYLDRPYVEPYDVPNLGRGYNTFVLYTDLKYTFDLVDIYSFAKNVNNVLKSLQSQGYPENFVGPLFAFFILEHEVYALASMGKLGRLGELLDEKEYPYRFDNLVYNVVSISTDTIFQRNGKTYHYGFAYDYEKQLYQCMKLFKQLNCDIEIFKLERGYGSYSERKKFIKGWYATNKISDEESL